MMPKPQLRLRIKLLPVLVGLLLFLHLTSPYRGWRILLIGLGGVWLISYLWARALAHNLGLVREMRLGWVKVGDHMIERFVLTNDSWANALWIEVLDHSNLPDYRASRATSVSRGRSIRWHREIICTRRGLFTLGPTSLRTGDPFWIYSVTLHYPATLPLMVLPPIVHLPMIKVAPGGRVGEGRLRPNAMDRTVSASSVREYVSGDSMRWIHWRTSARRDSLFVRLFDSTPSSDWWILLDMDELVQAGEGQHATEEHGVILAASLADQGLRAGQAVGLVTHGEELMWLPPQEGEGRRWEILRALAVASLGSRPLGELLTRMGPALGQHPSLVVITPAVDGDWVESLVPLLRRGVTPTVLLLDRASFGGNGDASGVATQLLDLGVAHYIITSDLLDLPEVHPDPAVQWAWKILGTGQAVAINPPREATWRVLS
jgi:uncharacterized protein (DUF58 family)